MSDQDFLAELMLCFFEDSFASLETTEACFIEIEKGSDVAIHLDEINRLFHNIKGGAKSIGFNKLGDFCHKVEDLIVSVKNKSTPLNEEVIDCLLMSNDILKSSLSLLETESLPEDYYIEVEQNINTLLNQNIDVKTESEKLGLNEAVKNESEEASQNFHVNQEEQLKKVTSKNINTGIKVSLEKIDSLVNLVGEQAINISKANTLLSEFSVASLGQSTEINNVMSKVNKLTYELQEVVLSLRMVKVDRLFSRLERVAREVSKQLNKKIIFKTEGKDNELDKSIVDALLDPLTHMIRNAVDHGLERSAEERIFAGKDEIGVVKLSAYRKGGSFVIEVSDDGRGIDKNYLKQKAIEKGLISEQAELSDYEAFSLIFKKGLSSKEQVTDVSGRGVGMDVVNEMITTLRGDCDISSELGLGTSLKITLPLNLAMINSTLIETKGQNFLIPNSDYYQTIKINGDEIKEGNVGKYCIQLNSSIVPVLPLHTILDNSFESQFKNQKYIAALVEHKKKNYAILFDELLSQEKVLLKKVDQEIESIEGVLGGAILGDGNVTLVLEVKEIIESYMAVG